VWSGTERLPGGGDENLQGGTDNDVVFGGLGTDSVMGGPGDDVFNVGNRPPFGDVVTQASGKEEVLKR
jgi:Ca2+-binding RTX toxin-like protein